MARLIIPALEAPIMMLSTLMKDCILHLAKVEGYSPSTLENYERTFRQFLAYLRAEGRRDELESFTDGMCLGFMDDLGARGAGVNTIVNKLAALSSFAVYGMRARNKRERPWFAMNPTKTFKWPMTRRANIPIITPAEVHAFLSVPLNGGKAMIRDLLFDTGLRVSEIAEANAEDLLRIGDVWFLDVAVKSRGRQKRRQFPVSADVAVRLSAYVRERAPLKPEAPLIVRRDGKRYSRSHLGRVVDLIGKAAGITRLRMSPHKVRHLVNVWGRLGGADALSRSALLGHSSPQSIKSYEHVLDYELHQARARQRQGMRQYLEGADSTTCATPVNVGGFPQDEESGSPVFIGAGDDLDQKGSCGTYPHLRIVARPFTGRVAQISPASDYCRCGAASVDHDYLLSADDRLIGACGHSRCESFEAA